MYQLKLWVVCDRKAHANDFEYERPIFALCGPKVYSISSNYVTWDLLYSSVDVNLS